MPYLAWIASELGSANSFPKGNIIPQKPQREGAGCGTQNRLGAYICATRHPIFSPVRPFSIAT